MNRFLTILALYWFVGGIAWFNGYTAGLWVERRRREEWSWAAIRVVDLTEPVRPYDWQLDGGGECPDCGGTGWASFTDPFIGGGTLAAACPTCSRVTP